MYKRFCLFLILFLFCGLSVSAATLSLSPALGTYNLNNTITVSILLDTQQVATDGVDIHYLNYPASLLEVQDENSSVSGVQIAPGTLYSITPKNIVDTANGRIDFSQVASGGSTFTGLGTLATIRFKVLAGGTANVNFNFTSGSTVDTNVASGGQDVLSSVTNGTYTLNVPCTSCGLETPILNPTSPTANQFFNISCPTTVTGLDCINAFAGSNDCSNDFLGWSGNTAIFRCSGMSAGSYQAKCQAVTGTSANCCADEKTASFTVTQTDISPPARSSGQPTGTLFAGTTQINMSLATNENANCRYSTNAGTSYDSMTNTFSTTGGILHSTEITNLSNGNSYYYYVRCADDVGNKNSDDFQISFSVGTDGNGGNGNGGNGNGDTTPPLISDIKLKSISFSFAVIGWKTNEPSSSQVEYGLNTNYGFYTILKSSLSLEHEASLFDLQPNTLYHFRLLNRDAAGNLNLSSDNTFTTSNKLLGDFNGDGKVNIYDFSILLSNWKTTNIRYDLNGDGFVDISDFSIMLSNWTG